MTWNIKPAGGGGAYGEWQGRSCLLVPWILDGQPWCLILHSACGHTWLQILTLAVTHCVDRGKTSASPSRREHKGYNWGGRRYIQGVSGCLVSYVPSRPHCPNPENTLPFGRWSLFLEKSPSSVLLVPFGWKMHVGSHQSP